MNVLGADEAISNGKRLELLNIFVPKGNSWCNSSGKPKTGDRNRKFYTLNCRLKAL